MQYQCGMLVTAKAACQMTGEPFHALLWPHPALSHPDVHAYHSLVFLFSWVTHGCFSKQYIVQFSHVLTLQKQNYSVCILLQPAFFHLILYSWNLAMFTFVSCNLFIFTDIPFFVYTIFIHFHGDEYFCF